MQEDASVRLKKEVASHLEGIADLAADVAERDVQAGHDDRLQFAGRYDVWIESRDR